MYLYEKLNFKYKQMSQEIQTVDFNRVVKTQLPNYLVNDVNDLQIKADYILYRHRWEDFTKSGMMIVGKPLESWGEVIKVGSNVVGMKAGDILFSPALKNSFKVDNAWYCVERVDNVNIWTAAENITKE